MSDTLRILLLAFILAFAFGAFATILQEKKNRLLALISDLVQRAQTSVEGTKMGAEKKRKVIAQLEAQGIKVTAWMSKAIDDIVAGLNENKAWFTEVAKDTLSIVSLQLADTANLIISELENKLKEAVTNKPPEA